MVRRWFFDVEGGRSLILDAGSVYFFGTHNRSFGFMFEGFWRKDGVQRLPKVTEGD